MEKLHILYIITKLELGGAQKVCLTLFNGINNSGNNSMLISGNEGILTSEIQQNCKVILLKNFKREISIIFFVKEIRNFIELVFQIKKIKKIYPNLIVHTHSTKAGLLGRWAAFFAGIKFRIHTIHGYAFHNHQNKLVWLVIYLTELFTCFVTSHYVCVSSQDVKTGIKLFPFFKKKSSIIRAAINQDSFNQSIKNYKNRHNKFIFGTVACFKKQKNLIDLFRAFKVVNAKNRNCQLQVIGDGILRSELENWINDNHLEDKIILLGWQKNVSDIMINWDAFVLSSLWEGLPCAVVEARLLKLPVISYNTGGIKDIIFQNKNGFLVDQKNWQMLAEKMLILSKNSKLCFKLSEFNENLTDFNNKNMIQSHINLYKKLLIYSY